MMKHIKEIHPGSEPYICPNCNSYLRSTDSYCTGCGQKRIEKEDFSVSHLFQESFLDYFHIDSSLNKSIVPLVLKPGYLTIEYLRGKRASYVQPFKMFLVVSLIYFLLSSIEMPHLLQPAIEKEINNTYRTLQDSGKEIPNSNDLKLTINDNNELFEPADTIRKKISKYGLNVYMKYKYPSASAIPRYLIKKVIMIKISHGSFYETMRHTSSRLIFLLIPVAALLFKLIYVRRKRLYYEHLIFSLHFHTFVFLLFILFQLAAILYKIPMMVQLTIILLYLFVAMKKMYSQTITRTIGNLIAFFFMYILIAFPLFLILLTGVSLATY
jgi:hypothetical protein